MQHPNYRGRAPLEALPKSPRALKTAQRRAIVSTLLLQWKSCEEIHRETGIRLPTVYDDARLLRQQWADLAQEPRRLAEQELASLGGLEAYAAQRLADTKSSDWYRVILETKSRRARLLGLDAPAKVTVDIAATVRTIALELGADADIVLRHLVRLAAELATAPSTGTVVDSTAALPAPIDDTTGS